MQMQRYSQSVGGPNPNGRHAAAFGLLLTLLATPVAADEGARQPSQQSPYDASGPGFHHGFSFFRELRYPPEFTHFDYVNPDAPIGGELVLPVVGTFNSFTPWIQKGINPAGYGFVGAGIFLFDRVLEPGDDDPSAQYARLGVVEAAPDYSWFKVRIHPEARWHDGVPVTPADILYTVEFVVNYASAAIRTGLGHFDAEQTGEDEVTIHITNPAFRNPSAGLSVGHLPILPAHYWARPENDITKTSVEPPLGSGPYRIAEFELGRRIVYERVDDYWGWQLPSVRGKYNYQRIVFEYFRDNTVAREAAKKGIVTFRGEGVAKDWATSYTDFPARDDGYFVLELAERRDITAMASSIVLNTRREKLKDRRVRKALLYAYDFEWVNRVQHFGFYRRVDSFFDNSDLESGGIPTGRELELLEAFREELPPELFRQPFVMPQSDGRGMNRANMLEAQALFAQAGWHVVDERLANADGEQFTFEFMARNPAEERSALPYVAALKRLGIDASIRTVDPTQFRSRLRGFAFDAALKNYWATPTLGTYLKSFFHSSGAHAPFTENWAGIESPAVDSLIARALTTYDREELYATGHALDRVLLHGHYLIPTQVESGMRWTYWDRFGRPERSARYRHYSFPETWWIDPEKDAAVTAYLERAEGEG